MLALLGCTDSPVTIVIAPELEVENVDQVVEDDADAMHEINPN